MPKQRKDLKKAEIGIMRHQCLRRCIPDDWTLRAELIAWELHANSADDAKRVFSDYYYPSNLDI